MSPSQTMVNVNEEADKPYSETLLLFRDDEIKIPSLTKTFLQNRTIGGDKEKNPYAGSVIKINVTPQQPVENRTIVTITPQEEPSRICEQIVDDEAKSKNGKTSITINFDDRSPKQCQRNNTVTINVGYKDCQNDQNYKSNVQVTPECNQVYVKPSDTSESNEISTQTETDPVQVVKKVPRTCGCETVKKSNHSDKENTSGISGDSFEEPEEYSKPDFSLHYMSCKINEKLTEDDVGLYRPEENGYDLAEPIYEEISETPPPLPLEPPPAKVDDIGIVIPPRSIFEGASKYDILRYLAGAKERCRIPEEPEFIVEETSESEPSELPSSNHSRIGSLDLSSRISHLSNVSDSSDELVSFLNATIEKVSNGLFKST